MTRIAVIGAGTMGNGIAHTAAASGIDTSLVDVSDAFLERAVNTISRNLQRGVDKGKMTVDEKESVLSRITTTTDIDSVAGADLVVEAIIENLAAKVQLFERLDRITRPECIL